MPWRTTVDSQEDFERFLDKYADLDVHESACWPAAVVRCLARFKRPNLAIAALVAVVYKGLPMPIMLAAIGAITLLGLVGGRGDG
jgi:hypothetical protein